MSLLRGWWDRESPMRKTHYRELTLMTHLEVSGWQQCLPLSLSSTVVTKVATKSSSSVCLCPSRFVVQIWVIWLLHQCWGLVLILAIQSLYLLCHMNFFDLVTMVTKCKYNFKARLGLTTLFKLGWQSLYNLGWPWTDGPLASISNDLLNPQ